MTALQSYGRQVTVSVVAIATNWISSDVTYNGAQLCGLRRHHFLTIVFHSNQQNRQWYYLQQSLAVWFRKATLPRCFPQQPSEPAVTLLMRKISCVVGKDSTLSLMFMSCFWRWVAVFSGALWCIGGWSDVVEKTGNRFVQWWKLDQNQYICMNKSNILLLTLGLSVSPSFTVTHN